MPIFNLNPTTTPATTIGINEDTIGGGNRSTVSVTNVSSIVLPANSNRGSYQIYNNSTTPVFIAHGSSVSAANFETPIPGGNLWYRDPGEPRYYGSVAAITASGTASLQVTEYTII
jgi:hypothetical protein